jgi:hypothetical protein
MGKPWKERKFYGNQYVNRWIWNPIRTHMITPIIEHTVKPFIRFCIKATKVTIFLILVTYAFIQVGFILNDAYGTTQASATATSTAATSTPMTKSTWHEIYENYPFPPFLQRICKAEHSGGHFDKNGQVIINPTMDMGECQINVPIHGKTATEMGYNLAVKEDNREFALYLFLTEGTKPWNSSKARWDK